MFVNLIKILCFANIANLNVAKKLKSWLVLCY
jgi:hypothetical protein